MTFITSQSLTLKEFLEQYGDHPDVIVLDENQLKTEPLWQREPIICNGNTIKLVVEVVSTNWQDDYARKVEEYAFLGIPEYWIVDYRGLGGVAFIGKPKQRCDPAAFQAAKERAPREPTFTVSQLVDDEYINTKYYQNKLIQSNLFPEIQLYLDDLLI